MWALDTNTVIYYFKGMGHVAERLLEVAPNRVSIPSVVVYEIEVGILKSGEATKRRRQFGELFMAVTVLPFASDEAQRAAQVRT